MRTCYGWVEIDGVPGLARDLMLHRNRSVEKRSKKKSRKYRGFFGHTPLADSEIDFLRREKPRSCISGGQLDNIPITAKALEISQKFGAIIRLSRRS